MKKKLLALLCISIAGAMFITVGCSAKKEAPKVTEEKSKKLESIGIEKDSDYKVELKNNTGKKIISLSVKVMEDTAYPESMLKAGEIFEAGESRNLFYKAPETSVTGEQGDKMLNPGYDIQLAFEDNTIAELHAFPFEDIKKGEICFEEVAYLKYTSKSSKQKVDTKEAELAVKDQKEAAEEEAARQAAEEAARKAAEEEAAHQAAEEAARKAAEEEAARQAAEEAARRQAEQQNNSQDDAQTAGDGCVQDGLLW